jgi:hypothetical protein
MRSFALSGILLSATLAGALSAGPITVVAQYNLDGNGNDSSGNGLNLTASGTPGTSGGASTFDGTSYFSRPGVATSATDNFVMQVWALATSSGGNRPVFYNGNSGNSGFGVYQANGVWGLLFGGNIYSTHSAVTLNEWTQLTIARASGVTTFYVNATPFNVASAPNAAAGNIFIGGNPLLGTERFQGSIDQARIFTFAAGTLTAQDLQLVPEPGTFAMAMTGAALLLAGVRSRRRNR